MHFDLLRQAGGTRRAQMAMSLSALILGMARRSVQREAPHASKAELDILFVERVYGRELADGFRAYLESRRL